eukprot:g46165.t1
MVIAEARCQLSDASSYRPLDHDPTPDHQNIVSQTIHNLITSGYLPPTASNLMVPQPRTTYGLKALRFFLSCRPNHSPSTDTLIHLTELVFIFNNFSFNSSHFRQTKGLAMGTCMGPSYACLFIGYVEQFLFRSYTGIIPHLFLRDINDGISAASCIHGDLEQFNNFTITFHPNLKFTWTISDTSLSFLDLS